jgi:hypothetical protein
MEASAMTMSLMMPSGEIRHVPLSPEIELKNFIFFPLQKADRQAGDGARRSAGIRDVYRHPLRDTSC